MGRGSPRFFEILKTSHELQTTPTLGVFPAPSAVKKCFEGREGSKDGGQDGRGGQDKRDYPSSCPSYPSCPQDPDPSLPPKSFSAPEIAGRNGSIAARIVTDFDKFGFRIALAPDGSLAIQDLAASRQRPRSPPPQLIAELGEHADEIGRWLEEGGTI
jgi:hypothetical protein